MDSVDDSALFSSAFISRLEQLFLLSRKVFRGDHRAERPSRKIGASLEFADYRNYVRGDDLRSIDWNIYGRLDRLFIKLFEEEQDLHVYLLLDASASMHWSPGSSPGWSAPGSFRRNTSPAEGGERPAKFDQARRIAAALAYIGLSNLDRVNIFWFTQTLGESLGLVRGRTQFHKILQFLRRPPASDRPTSLLGSMKAFAQRTRRRGLVILLSDFFDPNGFEEALAVLNHYGFEVQVIQVLDPGELDPPLGGDLTLRDPETGGTLAVTVTPTLLKRYREGVNSYLTRLDEFCREHATPAVRASTAVPFEELVLKLLRSGALLK